MKELIERLLIAAVVGIAMGSVMALGTMYGSGIL